MFDIGLDIGYLLFLLGFVGVLTLYMTLRVFVEWNKSKRIDMYGVMSGGILPLGLIGAYFFVISIYGQLYQPLPSPLNTLVFNTLLSLSLVLIGFVWSIRANVKMEYVGLLALLLGLLTIYYGYQGYTLGLTQSASQFFLIYFVFGIIGMLAFPVSLIIDLKPGNVSKHPQAWGAFLALFCMFLLLGIMMALLGALFNEA